MSFANLCTWAVPTYQLPQSSDLFLLLFDRIDENNGELFILHPFNLPLIVVRDEEGFDRWKAFLRSAAKEAKAQKEYVLGNIQGRLSWNFTLYILQTPGLSLRLPSALRQT